MPFAVEVHGRHQRVGGVIHLELGVPASGGEAGPDLPGLSFGGRAGLE